MNKSLVIAEKPSVASDIAKALGGFKKLKGCLRARRYGNYICCWSFIKNGGARKT